MPNGILQSVNTSSSYDEHYANKQVQFDFSSILQIAPETLSKAQRKNLARKKKRATEKEEAVI